MTRRKKISVEHKPLPEATKTQGLVVLGRTSFIDEIIQKFESQASVGPWIAFGKGFALIPQVEKSPIIACIKIHNKTEGSEHRFQSTNAPHSIPSQEVNSCNLKEGDGETSGVGEADSESGSPVILKYIYIYNNNKLKIKKSRT